jgi:hypothetical protein
LRYYEKDEIFVLINIIFSWKKTFLDQDPKSNPSGSEFSVQIILYLTVHSF